MKLVFWLLDINTQIESGAELWLWGIDEAGNHVLVIDRHFTAYFFAIVQEGFKPSKVAEAIQTGNAQEVVDVQVIDRRFFGKPIKAIKINCKEVAKTGKLAKEIEKVEGVADCLEDDIRAAMRYLIDNNIAPCSWLEVEATEEENTQNMRVSKVYSVRSSPKQLDKVNFPNLRVLGFSMICYSQEGMPKADRNPVVIISTAANNGETKQFIANEDKDDKPIITAFFEYMRQYDPDIIVSYGANTLDWNYLKLRSHKLRLKLKFDRAGLEPHTGVYGHVSLTGIANVDLADFIDMFPEVKVKTLDNLANHLGILDDEATAVEDVLFADYWDNNRGMLEQFALESARRVQGTAGLLLDFAMQLANLTSLPLDHVMTAATGFRVEWFLIKQTQRKSELTPKRVEQPYIPYVGGMVLSPKPGLHDNIAVLDFKSMYPNIMLNYNLSPDTYIAPQEPEPEGGTWVAPEVGHRFRKSPPGFYKEALSYLIKVRDNICQKMKTLNPKTFEYQVLDARQKVVKILANATYGYAGWIGARWYLKPVAEAASAWGRHTISVAMYMAQNAGIEVVYGDTDSLFIKYDAAKAEQLKEAIIKELNLEVQVGEVYQRIFFTEAKKRYAGLRNDGSLDIVGLEVIRGDWAIVAKRVQEEVLEIILKEQSPNKAVEYVHSVVQELRKRKVPLRDLIIWKTLTKSPEDYEIKAPHVEAAKMLKDKGWRLSGGDKIGYVVLAGKGRLYNRVKPYVFSDIKEVDVDYYVTNQVLPAAARILSYFNIEEAQLLRETAEIQVTKSLLDYL